MRNRDARIVELRNLFGPEKSDFYELIAREVTLLCVTATNQVSFRIFEGGDRSALDEAGSQ
ncbi:hypothetical protein [Achromobacter sp.]|uniref:hypothetical protein n=1 Tax=Achromobacter sp. TaxID=134375 RepID=UPI003C75B1BF